MVVFTLKCMCATIITDGFQPQTCTDVIKAVRDALAHVVWLRGYTQYAFESLKT